MSYNLVSGPNDFGYCEIETKTKTETKVLITGCYDKADLGCGFNSGHFLSENYYFLFKNGRRLQIKNITSALGPAEKLITQWNDGDICDAIESQVAEKADDCVDYDDVKLW